MVSSADIEKSMRISKLLDVYGALLSQKQNEIISMYYNDDLSLGEISELLGLTRQGVRDAIIKGAGLLSDFEEKLGVLAERERYAAVTGELLCEIKSLRGAAYIDVNAVYERLTALLCDLCSEI